MEEENGARRACKRAFNEVPDSVHATVGRWEIELYFLLFTDRETLMSEPGLEHGTGRENYIARWVPCVLTPPYTGGLVPTVHMPTMYVLDGGNRQGPRSRWLQPLCSETCLQILSLTCRSPCRKPGWVWTLLCHALQVLGWRPRSLSKTFVESVPDTPQISPPGENCQSTADTQLVRVCQSAAHKSELKLKI